MAVGSTDGRQWADVPDEFACSRISAWCWHPAENALVWAGAEDSDSPCRLFLWTVGTP
ncbi:MAG: hypothetical protein HY720_16255 [Planctomycetes bacterium]|nr:hypothetical protein [Planctomycetota bacterium]